MASDAKLMQVIWYDTYGGGASSLKVSLSFPLFLYVLDFFCSTNLCNYYYNIWSFVLHFVHICCICLRPANSYLPPFPLFNARLIPFGMHYAGIRLTYVTLS